MFGCHGGEAVGLGYRYIDNLLTGHFLIRSLLDTDTLCTQGLYLGVCVHENTLSVSTPAYIHISVCVPVHVSMCIQPISSLSLPEAAVQTLEVSIYRNKQWSHFLNRHLVLSMRPICQYFHVFRMPKMLLCEAETTYK